MSPSFNQYSDRVLARKFLDGHAPETQYTLWHEVNYRLNVIPISEDISNAPDIGCRTGWTQTTKSLTV